MGLRILIISTFLLAFQPAFGFVQNVTHGYPACVSCHVSPNGGGLLTDYGRSLSKELMSTWGISERFAQPYFGALKNKDTVKFGGDLRSIQSYIKNNNVDQGKFFPMQQNLELGVRVDNVMFVGTAGLQQGPDGSARRGQFLSERHYALWSPSQTSKLRAGKFRQTFGINTDNHTRLIKNLFGFGAISETYNLEFSKFYETYEITVGASLGRLDTPRTTSEQNISAHYTYYLNENSRIGGSLLMGESSTKRRFLSSLNGVLPLGEDWVLMSEIDYELSHFTSNPNQQIDTIASLIRFGNKPFKGVMWYLLFEHASVDSGSNYSLITQPGIGVQWLPIPHFNIQIEYARQTNNVNPGNINEIGFVMFHTYL